LFIGSAIILVGLVGSLNCLQGTQFIGTFSGSGLKCPFALTSNDLIIKIGATAIFILFLALLFGPILGAMLHPQSAPEKTEKPSRKTTWGISDELELRGNSLREH
jgi:hypothetical protein